MERPVTITNRISGFSDSRFSSRIGTRLVLCALLLLCSRSISWGVQPQAPTLSDYASIRSKVVIWIDSRTMDSAEARADAATMWPVEDQASSLDALWDRALRTFAKLDPATRDFLVGLEGRRDLPRPVDASLLFETERGDFYLSNMRMHYVRWLVQREFSELALELIDQINASEVISPAAYYFYKAACQRRLLQRNEGMKTLEALLALPKTSPERYFQLGELMKQEWSALEEKSLEEVSMLMDDVRRRLNLAQPGQKTQNAEDQVVKRLDEIIKKLEDQQNGGGGGSAGRQSNSRPGTPADDSRIHGEKKPGEVDPKTLKTGGEWGNLDEKKRSEVQNLISRDFPAYYRRTIEEYFRKLATRKPSGE